MLSFVSRSWRAAGACALLAGSSVLAACGGGNNFAPPVGATPIPVTEVFEDTLSRNGAKTYPFAAQAGGTVTATLTSIEPAAAVGLSLGTWNGQACQIIIANDRAVTGTIVVGTASAIGNLCVRVYDIGEVTGTVLFRISVFHP